MRAARAARLLFFIQPITVVFVLSVNLLMTSQLTTDCFKKSISSRLKAGLSRCQDLFYFANCISFRLATVVVQALQYMFILGRKKNVTGPATSS